MTRVRVDQGGNVLDTDPRFVDQLVGRIEKTDRKREPWTVIVCGLNVGRTKTRDAAVALAVEIGEQTVPTFQAARWARWSK